MHLSKFSPVKILQIKRLTQIYRKIFVEEAISINIGKMHLKINKLFFYSIHKRSGVNKAVVAFMSERKRES